MLNPQNNEAAETASNPETKKAYAIHVTKNREQTRRSLESVGLNGKLFNVTTSVPKRMLDAIEAEAAESGVSRSDICRAGLMRELAFRQYCRQNKVDAETVSAFSVRPYKGKAVQKVSKVEERKEKAAARRALKKLGII